jgi:hypothetical protein
MALDRAEGGRMLFEDLTAQVIRQASLKGLHGTIPKAARDRAFGLWPERAARRGRPPGITKVAVDCPRDWYERCLE